MRRSSRISARWRSQAARFALAAGLTLPACPGGPPGPGAVAVMVMPRRPWGCVLFWCRVALPDGVPLRSGLPRSHGPAGSGARTPGIRAGPGRMRRSPSQAPPARQTYRRLRPGRTGRDQRTGRRPLTAIPHGRQAGAGWSQAQRSWGSFLILANSLTSGSGKAAPVVTRGRHRRRYGAEGRRHDEDCGRTGRLRPIGHVRLLLAWFQSRRLRHAGSVWCALRRSDPLDW